jgi:hypothetical protein
MLSKKSDVTEEYINYIILLSALQVVYNTSLELQNSKFYSSKVKIKVKEAINILTQTYNKDLRKIWNMDEKMAADFMYGIQGIGEQIAKTNGLALPTIADLIRKDIDLSKFNLIEVKE